MIKKLCSLVALMVVASLYGCGGGGGDGGGTSQDNQPSGTKVLSATQTSATGSAGADVFRLTSATTAGYAATITGFAYPTDKISYPVGGARPTALAGGVNDVTDGQVDLTWNSNGQEVIIHLTGLDATSEAALQSSAADAVAAIYTTYTP